MQSVLTLLPRKPISEYLNFPPSTAYTYLVVVKARFLRLSGLSEPGLEGSRVHYKNHDARTRLFFFCRLLRHGKPCIVFCRALSGEDVYSGIGELWVGPSRIYRAAKSDFGNVPTLGRSIGSGLDDSSILLVC